MEAVEDGEVVDAAAGALGEAEAGGVGEGAGGVPVEVAVLDADEATVCVEVGDLEPVDAVAVTPGGEAAEADDARVEEALGEEELPGFVGEAWMVEEVCVAGGVEGDVG